MKDRPKPDHATPQLVDHFIRKFDQDDDYAVADRALTRLLRSFPNNENVDEVLLKVCSINSLYSTQIYGVLAMAKHITGLRIDPLVREGVCAAVSRIAILQIGGRVRVHYSFATKYCSWHNPTAYPIYDRFAQLTLLSYRDHFHFADFTAQALRNYHEFRPIVTSFRDFFGLSDYSFKQLDRFLWMYGRALALK